MHLLDCRFIKRYISIIMTQYSYEYYTVIISVFVDNNVNSLTLCQRE